MIYQHFVSKKVLRLATQHANYYSKSLIDRYARRGQYNSSKIIQDMIIGKIGEIETYLYFVNQYGVNSIIHKPYVLNEDMSNVRDDDDFEHDADLIVNEMNIHIKTQNYEQSKRFGSAWVFQRSHVSALKQQDTSHDHVAFCEVDLKKNLYSLKVFKPLDYLLDNNMFRDMKIQKYNHGPRAKFSVHYEDFEDFVLPLR